MKFTLEFNALEIRSAICSGTLLNLVDSIASEEKEIKEVFTEAFQNSRPMQQPPIQQPPMQQQPIQQQIQQQMQQQPIQQPPMQTAIPTAAPTYTLDQLAQAATQLVDAGRRVELVEMLKSFGIQALNNLPKEHYGAFVTQLRARGAKI